MTAPYNPQQNGVVERRNRTVMEMSRALLKSMKVPGRLWVEVVRHSVYLLNRLSTKAMGYIEHLLKLGVVRNHSWVM
jgi:transposase InsO family protein